MGGESLQSLVSEISEEKKETAEARLGCRQHCSSSITGLRTRKTLGDRAVRGGLQSIAEGAHMSTRSWGDTRPKRDLGQDWHRLQQDRLCQVQCRRMCMVTLATVNP